MKDKVLHGGNFHGPANLRYALGVTQDGKIYYSDEKGNWTLYVPGTLPDIPAPLLSAVLAASSITGYTGSIVLTDGTIAVSGGIITGYTAATP